MNGWRIEAVAAFADNYIWLLHNGQEAVCVDPGDHFPVADFLRQRGLQLAQIWITHAHADHTGGVAQLKQMFSGCRIYGAADIDGRDETVGEGSGWMHHGLRVQVWHTPGHTENHLAFLVQTDSGLHVFCGDTLFSAGCGRAFSGRPDWLCQSLQRFDTLPPQTWFYPAHEYTEANLRFAAHIEPDNADIQAALAAAGQRGGTPTVPVTLAHERRVNPFLRLSHPPLLAAVEQQCGLADRQPETVFAALREWKNRF